MNGKIRVLIVEDDVPVAMQMVAMFVQAGHDAKAVCTGTKAMELATTKKFDLIVLDTGLSDMSGFEICDDLKQRHISRKTPIVFITGKPSEEDRKHGLKVGAVDYISKPFSIELPKRLLSHITPKTSTASMKLKP